MTPIELKSALHRGQIVYGTLIVSPSPFWPKAIKDCGLDFVFIDTEHIAIDRERLSWMCRTYSAMGLPPLVRIPDIDPNKATVAFDDGAVGVVAPYVETKEQAQALQGAAKLRPLKGLRVKETLSGQALDANLSAYVGNSTAENLLVLNIESLPAIDSLDSILEVESLDAVLIGPHDLSTSLSVPEEYGHPQFLNAVETILKKAREKGIGAGIHYWGTIDEQVRFIEMGANLVIHKADIIFMRMGLKAELKELRDRVQNNPPKPPDAGTSGVNI